MIDLKNKNLLYNLFHHIHNIVDIKNFEKLDCKIYINESMVYNMKSRQFGKLNIFLKDNENKFHLYPDIY